MYASTIVALFAVAVVARPQAASSLLPRDFMSTMTFREAQDLCGSNMEVSCCNKDDNTSSQNSKENDGPLSKLLPDANVLGGECLKLDLIPIIGDLLNKQCSGTVSCCDKSSSSSDNNLVGLNIPCLSLQNLL
ncbi:Hydrophobin, fungi [Ophiocordyceps sinensis CO18]|uniref:Hydrophobin n=1 Tax=Ophiocordyceps sinensis (strain Co18 / CGMCC 3.14243) TaxID=911162 RepID=T5AFJ2_OPHSC|nr:Hydrophobin, fungi [Ophiocordyceps sinensis CO18]